MPPLTEEEGEPPPTAPVWLAKGKAFCSAIAGKEELEILVHGFQLLEEEQNQPEIILKLLTERTKFVQMKQEPQ